MKKIIRIGTRESPLAVWQATQVKDLLQNRGMAVELVYIKSEGDIDLVTPLYEIGVEGIFTKELDIALLNNRIDIAVHSMKDVPVKLAAGLVQAAVLKRGPVWDLLVFKNEKSTEAYAQLDARDSQFTIATSSLRRKAQWLNKFPNNQIQNLRGNINTRLQKLGEESWDGAIFAQAGLERIGLRPANSIILDWMLPAPAQGAIVIICREEDEFFREACNYCNDADTHWCTTQERNFLKGLLGGCAVPISALAEIKNNELCFAGNILSPDGKQKLSIEKKVPFSESVDIGAHCADALLQQGGWQIIDTIRNDTA